jgi:hypothetical protein
MFATRSARTLHSRLMLFAWPSRGQDDSESERASAPEEDPLSEALVQGKNYALISVSDRDSSDQLHGSREHWLAGLPGLPAPTDLVPLSLRLAPAAPHGA